MKKTARVIILSGQSNAVGVGHSEYLPRHFGEEKTSLYRRGFEKVKIMFFSHNHKSDGFVPVRLGLAERDRDTFGPEVGIAEYFSETHPEEELFIIKCAFGGMSLCRDFLSPSGGEDYAPDAFADQYDNILEAICEGKPVKSGWSYNELVRIIRSGVAMLCDMGYEPGICGFCWMQGESDALDEQSTLSYRKHYSALLSDLKCEFGGLFETCAFVDAGISDKWPFYIEMNQLKKDFAAEAKDRRYIDTLALGLTTEHEPEAEPDIYHYDSDSVVRLGRRFAAEAGL